LRERERERESERERERERGRTAVQTVRNIYVILNLFKIELKLLNIFFYSLMKVCKILF
jgi:hypothetical protein